MCITCKIVYGVSSVWGYCFAYPPMQKDLRSVLLSMGGWSGYPSGPQTPSTGAVWKLLHHVDGRRVRPPLCSERGGGELRKRGFRGPPTRFPTQKTCDINQHEHTQPTRTNTHTHAQSTTREGIHAWGGAVGRSKWTPPPLHTHNYTRTRNTTNNKQGIAHACSRTHDLAHALHDLRNRECTRSNPRDYNRAHYNPANPRNLPRTTKIIQKLASIPFAYLTCHVSEINFN